MDMHEPLRVALVAGSLRQGGAERQLLFVARELVRLRARVTVHSVTRGEAYEAVLESEGLPVNFFGQSRFPVARVAALARSFQKARPHVVHATHFFCNLYATAGAGLCDAVSIGSLRSDLEYELQTNPHWGEALLRAPDLLLANSVTARERAVRHGVDPARVEVLPNAIDLDEFDAASIGPERRDSREVRVFLVGSLHPVKRVDMFLDALVAARLRAAQVCGIIVGDGSEEASLRSRAAALGLGEGGVRFLGRRNDIPAMLAAGDILALCSTHEGLPNVILEAMAAGLPVVTTPAGDAPRLVVEGATGFVVGHGDAAAMGDRFVRLASDPTLRERMGIAGRAAVEKSFARPALGPRLLEAYAGVLTRRGYPTFARSAVAR